MCGSLKKKHQYSQKTAITVKLLYRALVVFIRHVTLPLHCQLFFSAMTSLFKSLFFFKALPVNFDLSSVAIFFSTHTI